MKHTDEFQRAQALIEAAARTAHEDGADLATLAACLLAQSSAFYAALHGTQGVNGLPQALERLAASHVSLAAERSAQAAYGAIGRA